MKRFIGIDIGSETLKAVEVVNDGHGLRWTRSHLQEHKKSPEALLPELLRSWKWDEGVAGAAATGRFGRKVALYRVPVKQAQAEGHRFLHGNDPATIVSIGSRGFSILELNGNGREVFRENSRCAQGTGNFLRQLVERFDLDVQAASELAAGVADPAPLSGRCPVILKTDMTHLANKGEGRDRILAGLFDAICENVQVLLKPASSPRNVYLAGGVARSVRVQDHFRCYLNRHGMELMDVTEDGLFLEALGCAVISSEGNCPVCKLENLIVPPAELKLESFPSLRNWLPCVRRLAPSTPAVPSGVRDLVLGFDIGSTGSKAVAMDTLTMESLWEGYVRTNGNPVGASQELMRMFFESAVSNHNVRGFGVTGSGREIVGSLLSTCYGSEAVYVLNEIAAHAAGAVNIDPRVDTIFEIGGQDAKYIRLLHGRVVEAAMNEACSAGTGSFLEEQGRHFHGIEGIGQLAAEALSADSGVTLGQHCSVFMAEIIDEAFAAGVRRESIIAGIYDSVIANYLNRVKGSRPVGSVIFCQGMPFSSDALAAAVARQTGAEVIVPPKPGMMGAVGIALLAVRHLPLANLVSADCRLFLDAEVIKKDRFVCGSVRGCGGAGNKCKIDRLATLVSGKKETFTWGGSCSLYDRGTQRKKLPDLAPDPFRKRRELVEQITRRVSVRRGRPIVAMTDEFQLKGLFPFFANFIYGLGFDVAVSSGADREALKRGIAEANVPFCAPMQQFHGLVSRMIETNPDYLFLPMLREMPRVAVERVSVLCPIVQAAPDILRLDLDGSSPKILSPVIDMGPGFLESRRFLDACGTIAEELGITGTVVWKSAWRKARDEQRQFDETLLSFGREALDFCRSRDITPVLVLGRPYTIHNDILNSNVPSILREQGTIALPVDCYPVPPDAPVFPDIFWAQGQRILRAAWHARRQPDVYTVYCSNYSCGPDSFLVHFYAWLMEGRPFAIIETDGHSGDAGTKTRIEAFLHCVSEDRHSGSHAPAKPGDRLTVASETLSEIIARRERLLIPRMGPETGAVAAALRGLGIEAETLPLPTGETLGIGRRYTSGKECLPMAVTLGSLLARIEPNRGGDERFTFLMPGSDGPCRFGVYKNLFRLVLDRLGWGDRVRIWSPPFGDYFQGQPAGFKAIAYAGICAAGVLNEALHDVRPVETRGGSADSLYAEWSDRLCRRIEEAAAGDLSLPRTLMEISTGHIWGIPALLRQAAAEFSTVKSEKDTPNVLVVGEIYVRSDPFSNDFISLQLEKRGIRTRIEPVSEFIQYSDYISGERGTRSGVDTDVECCLRSRILGMCRNSVAKTLGWRPYVTVPAQVAAARGYLRRELEVESVLTVGVALEDWRHGDIDAVVSVGPLECLPTKIAEAQFHHIFEREGLLSLTIPLNGEPIDPEILDSFAFEVKQRHRRRMCGSSSGIKKHRTEGIEYMSIVKQFLVRTFIVIVGLFAALSCCRALDAEPESPICKGVLAEYPAIKNKLEKNEFGIPVYLESRDEGSSSQVEIFTILDHPFDLVRDSLQSPANWCDINSMLTNVKACTFRKIHSQWLLTIYSGREYYQPPKDAYKLDFRFSVTAQQVDYLSMAFFSNEGPLLTRDHRIKFEAVPLDGARTLVYFSYAFSYGRMARVAINSYFATIGRDKKGFSVVATGRNGEPVYLGGIRGAVERNAVRYYLALQTYMDTLNFHGEQGFEKRISRWYDLTGKFPLQLYEIEKDEYLANKRREHKNQLMLQKQLTATSPS